MKFHTAYHYTVVLSVNNIILLHQLYVLNALSAVEGWEERGSCPWSHAMGAPKLTTEGFI